TLKDRVFVKTQGFSEDQKQIILASLLGDGWLNQRKYGSPYFAEAHSLKKNDYLNWKAKQLNANIQTPCKHKVKGEEYFSQALQTQVNPAFQEFIDLCYKDGKKYISKEWLSQLSPLGLAIWIMDDGSINCAKTSYTISISLGVSEQEKINISEYFKERWSLNPHWCYSSEMLS